MKAAERNIAAERMRSIQMKILAERDSESVFACMPSVSQRFIQSGCPMAEVNAAAGSDRRHEAPGSRKSKY
jgi:hypothetical protein